VSVHPPHLLDHQGRPNGLPAAFIPFCAYSGNLAVLSEPIGGGEFPACNKFQPTLLDGQLCYSLNISLVPATQERKTESGKKKGILFAIDLNEDYISSKSEEEESRIYVYPESTNDGNTSSIHINTLSHQHPDTRAGMYVLTALKKMTGTKSFLALPDEVKGCQIEPQEECERRRLSEKAKQQCDCIPWILSSLPTEQVGAGCDVPHISRTVLLAPAAQTAPPATQTLTRTPSAAESPAPGSMLMLMFVMTPTRKNSGNGFGKI
jgi:hypothetical protein